MKFDKNSTDIYKISEQVYGEGTVSRTQTFVWLKNSQTRREDTTDSKVQPPTSRTDAYVDDATEMVNNDHHQTILNFSNICNSIFIKKDQLFDQTSGFCFMMIYLLIKNFW